MKTDQTLTKEMFLKRLGALCLKSGLPGFPKDELDQHILLKSAILMFPGAGPYTEKEVNTHLESWVQEIGQIETIDRITLRRALVDTGYLTRSKDGASYQVAQPGPKPGLFEPAIDQLDIPAEIAALREEMARRKREFMEKSKGK